MIRTAMTVDALLAAEFTEGDEPQSEKGEKPPRLGRRKTLKTLMRSPSNICRRMFAREYATCSRRTPVCGVATSGKSGLRSTGSNSTPARSHFYVSLIVLDHGLDKPNKTLWMG